MFDVYYRIQALLPYVPVGILDALFSTSAGLIAFAIGYKLGDKLYRPRYTMLFHLFVLFMLVVFLMKFC